MRLSLPVATYQHRSRQASGARLLNCFVETLPADARAPYVLTRAPGVQYVAPVNTTNLDAGPIQGMHAAHGRLYVICNGNLYTMPGTEGGTGTLVGAVPSATGDYDMDSNDESLVVTTGGATTYYYTPGTATFGSISDSDFVAYGDVSEVEFLNNFMLFVAKDSGTFFGADLGSVTAFDALNFATAEYNADNIVGFKADHEQLLIFGERTIEIWGSVEINGFPFQRLPNGVIQVGCLAGRTVCRLGSSVAWVADDFTVRVLEGVAANRVSTHAIEQWLRTVTPSTGRACSYQYEGHVFYVLTFEEGTRVFDLTTGEWHERQTYGRDNWVWNFATVFELPVVGSQVLVGQYSASNPYRTYSGDYWDGKLIGYLTPEAYEDALYQDEDATVLQRMEWVYQPIVADGALAFHHRLELVFERGIGTAGQGEDPEVMLDYSDDGGATWKSAPNRKLGQAGEYQKRAVWHALGSSRQRVYRAAVSDPVPVTLIETYLEVTGGRL